MSAAREASPVNKVNYEKLYDECQEELKTALLENSSLEFRLLQSNGLCENLKVSLTKAQDQSKSYLLILKLRIRDTRNFTSLFVLRDVLDREPIREKRS